MGIRTFSFLLIFVSLNLEARPVSYPGGITAMAFTDDMKDSTYMHYSPTYKYSFGIETVSDKHFKSDYLYGRFTYLMNRKNTMTSQRNLYFQSGISSKDIDDFFYGFNGDWETRRIFTSFEYKKVNTPNTTYSVKFIQAGIAPYLGEYGDLHTWLMVKLKKNSLSDSWSAFPFFKFFKGEALLEFGYNKTDWEAHFMYRF